MFTHAGLLTNGKGPFGPVYARMSSTGQTILVPRFRQDAKTEAQIEQRRRLDLTMRIGSQIYLGALKPFFTIRKKYAHALSMMAGLTLDNYGEYLGIPRFKLPPGPYFWPFATVTTIAYNSWPIALITTDWWDPHYETSDEWHGFLVYDDSQLAYAVPPGLHHDTDAWYPPLQGECTGNGCFGLFWITREILGRQTVISPIYVYTYTPWR